MPTKDSNILSVRLRNPIIREILERARRRKLTKNGWLEWAVKQGLRKHTKGVK